MPYNIYIFDRIVSLKPSVSEQVLAQDYADSDKQTTSYLIRNISIDVGTDIVLTCLSLTENVCKANLFFF